MINQALHKQPVALDRDAHRQLRMRRAPVDWSPAAGLNAYFLNAVEFADAGKDFPIVYVRAGEDPETKKPQVAPMAVFGLTQGENLFVDGGRWGAEYMPAQLRMYPFAMARVNAEQFAVCIDRQWQGFSETDGDLLFNADGSPSDHVKNVQASLETLEREMVRTRQFCDRLLALNLLHDMRFDAKLPDGGSLTVDGFLSIDEKALAALPDATVGDLHRSGILALVAVQMASLGHMRRLIDRRVRRTGGAAGPAAA
jgi:hypothetical protein